MAGLPPSLAPTRETIAGEEDLPFAFQWLIVGLGSVGRDRLEFCGGWGLCKTGDGTCWLEKKVTVEEGKRQRARGWPEASLFLFGASKQKKV